MKNDDIYTKVIRVIILCFLALIIVYALGSMASAATQPEYTSLGVPTDVDTSFKTYMDYRCVTNKASAQYKVIHTYGWSDENGFMRANRDPGIPEDYYLIALGSYYGTTMGTKYRITTSTGNVFYGMLADAKANIHTNATNQYAANKDVVEFLVDSRKLRKDVKRMGSANIYPPLSGRIAKVERIDFVEVPDPEPESFLELHKKYMVKETERSLIPWSLVYVSTLLLP